MIVGLLSSKSTSALFDGRSIVGMFRAMTGCLDSFATEKLGMVMCVRSNDHWIIEHNNDISTAGSN